MNNIVLDIAYIGTNYYGWQKQKSKPTIQGLIENSISRLLGKSDIKIIGAGRTDAGVHAYHQIANFKIEEDLKYSIPEFIYRLNSILPPDIKVQKVWKANNNFNSRFSAKKRTYIYYLYNSKIPSPFYKDFYLFYPYDIDFKLLKKSMKYFIGEKNFKSFSNSGNDTLNYIRKIYEFKYKKEKNIIEFKITANSFLYSMVRNIMGTILKINRERQNPEIIRYILKKEDRGYSGEKAPAYALFLYKIYY